MKKFKKLNNKKRTIQACGSNCQDPTVCITNCAGNMNNLNIEAYRAALTIQLQ